ncbi:MAG: pyrroline-5-carboxylate reductase [Streptosporangiales bacterium]|nr:pyrroline-5-carboxylate reductase [Streptosporangiales bacterium]
MTDTVAVLGVGKMGEALLSGMLRAGKPVGQLYGTTRSADKAKMLEERYGVSMVSNADAVAASDTLLLAVKPQDMGVLLDEIGPHVLPHQLVVSVAAGITTATVEAKLPANTPCVRVMSNTPVHVDEAMSSISGGSHAEAEHLQRAEEILRPVGKVIRVPESQQDAVTALAGSGPAYFYFLVEAMTDAGLFLGLPRNVAHDVVVQVIKGAAAMLVESGEHPVTLRENVTSPAGTTSSAIRELESHRVRAAVLDAIVAARDRSRELATGK